MAEVPKIVVHRLRAPLPAEPAHIEADLLTAFIEQTLSATERETLIEHLAQCGDCRESLTLALPPAETAADMEVSRSGRATAGAERGRTSSIWVKLGLPEFVWPSLRWAALAAGVVVAASVLLLHPGRLNQASVPSSNPQTGATAAPASNPITAPVASLPTASSPVSAPAIDQSGAPAKTGVAAAPEPSPKKTLMARNEFPASAPPIEKAKPALPATDLPAKASPAANDNDNDNDNPDARPPVTKADVQIVERAQQILNSESKWNRADTRKCLPDARTYSLYCALQQATGEVTGKFEHRGAAMQEARFVIDEIAPNAKNYHHRLMDYNNDSTTTFTDVQNFFGRLQDRVAKRLGEENQSPDK